MPRERRRGRGAAPKRRDAEKTRRRKRPEKRPLLRSSTTRSTSTAATSSPTIPTAGRSTDSRSGSCRDPRAAPTRGRATGIHSSLWVLSAATPRPATTYRGASPLKNRLRARDTRVARTTTFWTRPCGGPLTRATRWRRRSPRCAAARAPRAARRGRRRRASSRRRWRRSTSKTRRGRPSRASGSSTRAGGRRLRRSCKWRHSGPDRDKIN